jgi:hypothetical protein
MRVDERYASAASRISPSALLRWVAPWAAFAGLFLYGWRAFDLWHTLPAYEDVLEVTWLVGWYNDALHGLHGFQLYPLIFYPLGWHVATFGEGMALFALLVPLSWLGGVAFAYNVTVLLTFIVSFAGARKLAASLAPGFPAVVAALLYTFWGFRWFRVAGHMNVLLASALLPWMLWALERALVSHARRMRWLVVTGVLWALIILSAWYFLWVGGLALVGWIIGRMLARQTNWRTALVSFVVPALVGLVLTGPSVLWFMHETAAANATFYDAQSVSQWDASLNSLSIPSVSHPWLGPVSRWLYQGPTNEPGQANLGLAASLLALVSLWWVRKDRRWLPAVAVAVIGLILALGLTLKWNGQTVQWAALRPLDEALWRFGHWLKPGFFPGTAAPAPFDQAIPLPGLLLSAIVPFWERARVFARYAMLASMGVFLLASLTLAHIRLNWARWLLGALLLVEVLPPATQAVPYPPSPHPAFAWLAQQTVTGGVVDLDAWQPDKLYVPNRGEILWATQYHQKPTVTGASSVIPAHVAYLDDWLGAHPHAFLNPQLVPLLRDYGVQYIILYISGGYARANLQEAARNPDLEPARCFDPAPGAGAWPFPVCLLAVKPWPDARNNVLFETGWSGAEDWGRWVEGTEADAAWAAVASVPQRLQIEAFPVCVPGRRQAAEILVNGVVVATHQWQVCEPWTAAVTIPAAAVRVGWNEITLRAAYAARPADVSGDSNGDARLLSIGVNQLELAQP